MANTHPTLVLLRWITAATLIGAVAVLGLPHDTQQFIVLKK